MPPKCKFTREAIVAAGLELVRRQGMPAMTARAVGQALGASSKVIFSVFDSMEALQGAVLQAANQTYQAFLRREMERGAYPPYKASGMAYIGFARSEPELFKLLFMRDRSAEADDWQGRDASLNDIVALIRQNLGLDDQQARRFHLEMWLYVHGIATMIATAYLAWDMDFISDVLTDAYEGMKRRFCTGRDEG